MEQTLLMMIGVVSAIALVGGIIVLIDIYKKKD